MLRRHLLPVAVMLAIGMGGTARAQLTVIDPAEIAKLVQQAQTLTNQLTTMQQQYNQLKQTYTSMVHAPDQAIQQFGQGMNVSQFRNALPNPGSVNGMISGTGSLNSSGQTFFNQNSVYTPSGTDFHAQEMQRTANSIAGSQGMASDLYTSASNRIAALQGMEGQLQTATDPKQVADIQARLNAEQAYIQAQQVQATALSTWQSTQQQSEQQRQVEERRQEIDNLIAQAKAHGG